MLPVLQLKAKGRMIKRVTRVELTVLRKAYWGEVRAVNWEQNPCLLGERLCEHRCSVTVTCPFAYPYKEISM